MQEQNEPQKTAEDARQAHLTRRNRARGVVIALIVVALVSVLGNWLIDSITKEPTGPSLYVDPDEFYPVDEDEDIFQNTQYMGLDRRIHYYEVSTGALYSLDEEQLGTSDAYLKFFYHYFQCVIHGDEQEYISYFSDEYLEKKELPDDFTMQMIYDIEIKPHDAGEQGRDAYLVDYKIYRNNGTFRDDVASNASRTLLFYLVSEPDPIDAERTGGLVIDEIKIR